MNKIAHALIFAASLLGMSALAPSAAEAKCCVGYYDHDNADGNRTQIITQLTERINAMQLAIIEALRLGAGQASGNSKEQIGAQSNMANTQDDRSVVGRAEQTRMDAIQSAASGSSSCNVITGSRGVTGTENNTSNFAKTMTAELTNWDIGDEEMPSSRGADVAVEARVQRHCSLYANSDDIRSGLCTSKGSLANASIDISRSVYYRTPGATSMTLPQDRIDAAKTFLINAITPKPQGGMIQGDAKSTAGRAKAAARHAATARMSIAAEAANDILARRTPQADETTKSWAKDTAALVSGYTPDSNGGASWVDLMDVRSRAWYMNPSWGVGTDTQGLAQAQKDSTMMMAYQTYLSWETYKLMEKQNMMLATILAIQTEETR